MLRQIAAAEGMTEGRNENGLRQPRQVRGFVPFDSPDLGGHHARLARLGRALTDNIAERESPIAFAKACELGLEGIVSKRAGSFYKSGLSRNWLKTKNPDFLRT